MASHFPPIERRRDRWAYPLIVLACLLAFAPALKAGFIWDDAAHVTARTLQSWHGLWRIWTELGATQQYYPLAHSLFWVQYKLWAGWAPGYHLANVLLHATASCLVCAAVRRLGLPGAVWAGLAFAVHPVAVESVAWISEEKNTWSAIFYLLALLAYLDFDSTRRLRPYLAASLCFACALCCKTVTATLPAALLLLFWWRRGRLTWRDAAPLVPWFIAGGGMGILTAWVERRYIGAEGAPFALSPLARCLLAARVPWFYAGKNLWPAKLLFIYPHWTIDPRVALQWLYVAATLAALGLAWAVRAKSRAPLATVLFFGGTLFPALGFANVYPFLFSYVADHFQYLARLGVLVPAAALAAAWAGRLHPPRAAAVGCAAASVMVLWGLLSFRQARRYRDAFTLYTTELAENPDCWLFHHNLGTWYSDHGRSSDAIAEYQAALRLNPDYAPSQNNWGNELLKQGHPQAAIAHYRRALEIQPDYPTADMDLGIAELALHHTAEGLAALRAGVVLDPNSAALRSDLAAADLRAGRLREALEEVRKAVQLDPDSAEAEMNWGNILEQSGRFAEAAEHFHAAARLMPSESAAVGAWGRTLLKAGDAAGAIDPLERAVGLAPRDLDLRNNLAVALSGAGRWAEAIDQFEIAVRLAPDRADLRRNLELAKQRSAGK